jgi:MFS family permease
VTRGPLAYRSFRLLFSAQSISSLGDRLVPVALAFAVLDLTGSVTDLGIVLAAQTVPVLVFVLLGGVWADRLPRHRVMLASDLVRTVSQAATAALLLSGRAQIWELAALQAVYGAGAAFFVPAATALIPQTVAPESLQAANALIGLSGNFTSVLGPALAGVIVATIGAGWGLAIDAATFVGSAACLLLIVPAVSRAGVSGAGLSGAGVSGAGVGGPAEPAGTISELRAGWRAFRSRDWLWVTVAFFTLYIGFCFAPLQVLGPEVARRALGGPGAWAAISVALGAGAIVGGVLGFRLRPRHPLRAAFGVFLVATPTLIALIAAHASLWLIVPAALIDGSTGTLFNVFWFTALQSEVPAGELSRVASWDFLGSLALQPVGLLVAGPVAGAIGVSSTLYGAAGLALVLFASVLAVPAVRNFGGPAVDVETAGPPSTPGLSGDR